MLDLLVAGWLHDGIFEHENLLVALLDLGCSSQVGRIFDFGKGNLLFSERSQILFLEIFLQLSLILLAPYF